MFEIKKITNSICRNRGRSILLSVISFVFVCFMGIYLSGLYESERLLENLGEKLPVAATLTSLNGAKEIGLEINKKALKNFQQLDLQNMIYTSESYGNIEIKRGDIEKISIYMAATNTMSAFAIPEDRKIFDSKSFEKSLAQDEAVCLVNLDYMEERNVEIQKGDMLDINLFNAEYDGDGNAYKFSPVLSTKIQVVGFYRGETQENGLETPNIICPIKWLEKEYEKANVDLYYTSAQGVISNPLEINEFKESAKELNFKEINVEANDKRGSIALCINDKQFIETASQIMKNIRLLKKFIFPVMILIGVLEVVVFFCSIRSKRYEIYIERCLGRKKKEIVRELLIENFILATVGSALSLYLLGVTGILGTKEAAYLVVSYLGIVILSSFIPANLYGSVDPMLIFNQSE